MIRKYDNHYIRLEDIKAVSPVTKAGTTYMFEVLVGCMPILFKDNDERRINALRDRIINDWIENERK